MRKILASVTMVAMLMSILSLAGGTAGAGDERGTPRIVGGTAAVAGEFPYQVAIVNSAVANNYDAQFCGGSLITKRHVLTAAHCFVGKTAAQVQVLSDTLLLSTGGPRINVTAIHRHPSYNPTTQAFDFTVLELASPAPGTPVTFASPDDAGWWTEGTLATVSGWGNTVGTGPAAYPDELRRADVQVLSDASCQASYPAAQMDNMFCAGVPAGGIDSCQGDSGGPLVVWGPSGQRLQIGVVSWGTGCAQAGFPGVYSRIPAVYDWIAEFIECNPTSAGAGLTNMGFETGTFAGWTEGLVVDEIAVSGTDAFTAPYEGDFMARLGGSATSNQPIGPNEICQTFVVDQPIERFAYNIFTYDYTGYDEFNFDVTVEDPATGELIATTTQGAWGASGNTSLKTSGWRGVELNLAGRIGDTLKISFTAGGTKDMLYGFWGYLDSAESGLPPEPVVLAEVDSTSGSVMVDPFTGQVTIAQPAGAKSDIDITTTVDCPEEGDVPTEVTLLLGGTPFSMTETPPGSGSWSVTIPAASVQNGVLSIQANCPGGTVVIILGSVELYDPSGYLTDIITGAPIEGAEVTLYNVPGWTASTGPSDTGPTVCESNASKPAEDPWSQPAPTDIGVEMNPLSVLISPNVNPFISNSEGYYGWDVAAGCWYVVVEATGYDTLTSPVVGVPTEVTDLDLALYPVDLPSFPDVPDDHPFWLDITWMAYYEITTGFPNGTFRPGGDVTRQSMAAFLNRLDSEFGAASVRTACTGGDAFPDVPSSHPFCAEIQWMIDEGITTGFPDGNYRPGGEVTRQSMAAFLYRMAGSPMGPDPVCHVAAFPDVAASHPFCGEIKWMVDAGVTTGFPDGSFRPGAVVSRQAMSAFMHRFALLPV